MNLNTSFTKLVWRLCGAVIATLVTTFVAFQALPKAVADIGDCSLQDVAAWQKQIDEPEEEATPAYILRVTEAFLANCPNRPELADASRIAGMAATDNGDAKRAVLHFDRAGWIYDTQARLYYATALLADNYPADAWALRDLIADEWLAKLNRNARVEVETTKVPGGTLHAVRFAKPTRETGIGAAWVAIPDGPGWPATLTMGAERQRLAFQRLRSGVDAPEQRHIDLYRCRGRRMLARANASLLTNEMETAARVTMIGYLSKPDMLAATKAGEPLATCLWPERLFPEPAR